MARSKSSTNRSFVLGPWIVIIAIVAVAIFSKPTDSSFDDKLNREIRASLTDEQVEVKESDDLVTGMVKFGCALSKDACAEMIRSQMTVNIDDFVVAKVANVSLDEDNGFCLGAFRAWWCSL